MTTCFPANISDSTSGSSGYHLWDKWRNGQIEVMINGLHEDEILDTKDPSNVQHKAEASDGDVESWDDAFDFDSHQPFERILEQLQHAFPRSPLSDVSDQSDYFQPTAATSTAPITINSANTRPPASFYTHALPSPPTTTTATTLTSSKGTAAIPTFSSSSGSDGASVISSSHSNIRRLVGTTGALLKVDTRAPFHNYNSSSSSNDRASALPPLAPTLQARDDSNSRFLSLPLLPSTASSPSSSASSSPRAVTASVGAPSTTAASTRSIMDSSSRRGNDEKGKGKAKDSSEEEDFCPVLSTTAMTTITQEMMLSNLPAYTGIITRINPIKRVAAWVDDLEDLEVPEEDLNFNQVRSILAKSSSVPETLESIETWDTDSERSTTQSEDPVHPSLRISSEADRIFLEDIGSRKCSLATSETIETLDEDFDLSEDFGPLQLRLPPHSDLHSHSDAGNLSRKQSSLLRWQDLASDLDENDLENRSLSSSGSLSRVSMVDEDLLDGIVFPESMDNLRLVTDGPYRPERDPSVFGKESRMQEDDPEDFWEGLEIGDDSFNLQGRNKHLFVRPALVGRESSSSRVRREVVPLKDFVALPSRIPRLCRAPGDTSRPVTPAPSLSRMHSTHFDLPLRNLNSKSSLPRLKRSSISKREGSRVKQALSTANPHARIISGELGTSVASTPFASRASTPTAIYIPGSKRSSLGNMRDDCPGLGSSSLAMRTVSFTEPAEPSKTPAAAESTTVLPSRPISLTGSQVSAQTQGSGRVFPTLRMLVRKLDLGRPKLSARGSIPAFGQATMLSELRSTAPPDLIVPQPSAMASVHPLAPMPLNPSHEASSAIKVALKHPPNSRSSSFTDWGSAVGSAETAKESRPSSRAGPLSLGDISELSASDFAGETMTGASDQAALAEKFSRPVFLKRSPKQSMFGDGSELDRFDNLPTFGMGELPLTGNEDEIDRVKALQHKRQSTDRVAMWLRKPQSIVNMKEAANAIEVARPPESESSSSSIIRKTKSIRRSLFDIFNQVTQAAQPTPTAPVVPPPPVAATGKKKKRTSSGPTLIRDLSVQPKARKVSGMVYNPKDKMWDGNDDILDDFEDEDAEVAAATSAFASPATSPRQFEFPGSPLSHTYFPNSPFMGTACMSTVNRPALITNMNQHSKPRMQVAGKMVFDPTRMCWIINPEYLLRRKQQQQRRRHGRGDHARQRSMDEAWGDEPDVFAGLSESDKSQDEDEFQNEEGLNEREDWEQEGTTGTSSQSRSNARRLLLRPSLQRQPSHDGVAEHERLQVWSETIGVPSVASHNSADERSVGGTAGFHSVIPKSSRRSLNGHHGTSSGGVGSIGGGNNSRGEFEVGAEFDITETFLEQCIAAEAQHRDGAGRFFALPCSPVGVLQRPAAVATTGRLSKMTPSKMISLGKKSGKDVSRSKNEGDVKGKTKEIYSKTEEKTNAGIIDREMEMKERKLSFPTNPLMSWPPRSKGKSRSKSIQTMLLSDGSSTVRHSSGQPVASGLTVESEQGSIVLRRNSEGSAAVFSKVGNSKIKSKGKDKSNSKSSSSGFGSAKLLPPTIANNEASRNPAMAATSTLAARGRGGSRELFFHRPVRQKDIKRGTLSFAATLAAARRGGSAPFDRRKIGVDTFDPLRNPQHMEGQHHQTGRIGKFVIGEEKEEEEEEEEEDTMERGYRIMPNSRGRPPLRPRMELVLEFERHGQRYR
ncbi:hypothetical protein EC968_003512 [Mortierella alpina]|nr:hypothetical protein EC968_003512 [Mortierella alpina]